MCCQFNLVVADELFVTRFPDILRQYGIGTNNGMKILWLTWKDGNHPHAGGAETVNEELAKRLARDGHEVLFVVGGFPGCAAGETHDGFRVVRVGNRYSVYWHAYRYYKKNLKGWADLVIDEINTIPFFSSLYIGSASPHKSGDAESARRMGAGPHHLLFVHQLCREIWFHQMPFPISIAGYLLEPIYLRLLRKNRVITVSESTKRDLTRYGFDSGHIDIIPEGIDIKPIESLDIVKKYEVPTLLSFGAIRSMKRTIDQLRAFELAKESVPDLRFLVAGSAGGPYGKKFLEAVRKSPYQGDIEYLGRVSIEQKIELMRKSHLITVTSVKEGWGLVVSEANSQGTPAVVYDVDGLRDSVRDGETGLVVADHTPQALAASVVALLGDSSEYARFRKNAWEWSRELTFDRSYEAFRSYMVRDVPQKEKEI